MSFKTTRRHAITGIGLGFFASMLPKWIYARDYKTIPNKIVTYLNPETILVNRGVAPKIEKAEFSAYDEWKLSYRLWTAIGAGQVDNIQSATIGYLIIEKEKNINPGKFTLNIRQKILQQSMLPPFKDNFHLTEAKIICNENELATPVEWDIHHSLWRDNLKLDYCSFTERGRIESNKKGIEVRIEVNNIPSTTLKFSTGTELTSDLTLIAALPGMLNQSSDNKNKQFVMLEKLRLLKENHCINRNKDDDYVSDSFGSLHKIEHYGDGILPFDYWLDDNGCPLFLCTLHNAFIYDLKAEEKVEWICKTGNRRQFED